MDNEVILTLFDSVVADVAAALSGLEDWGPSGHRPSQYNHDVVADEVVLDRFLAEGFSVLTEESGFVTPEVSNENTGVAIVVDPVDGSTNASRGLPWYAISLCAVDAEGPSVAHVANLSTGDRFRAIRGEGVESNRAAVVPTVCKELSEAFVAFSGWPPEHGGWRQYRSYGAAALDLCAVADGAFDGFVEVGSGHGVWDYLGAALVCAEAGVHVVDGRGRNLIILDPDKRRAPVAAATPELLQQLVEMRAAWDPSEEE